MQTNNNNKNSTTMDLEKLKADFGVEMMAYKQAVADYMAVLKKGSSPYMLIGVGTNGYLYVKQSLDGSDYWQQVNDNSQGLVRSVCTGIDGKTIYGTNSNNDMIYKTSWDAPTWSYHSSYGKGKFQAVAACPDGTLLGVGMDNTLYTINADGSWANVKTSVNDGESEVGVAVGLDGSVFVCNGNGDVYKKNSYQNLPSQSWQGVNGCCVKAMTIAPDGTFIGVGMDNQLYTKDSYTDFSTGWKGPYPSSCCVVGITTVPKNPKMVSTQSQTYWGKGQVGTQGVNTNVVTVDDCVALCSTTSGCSGATFNPTDHGQPMCWLRSGDSDIGPGLYNDYSIVPETKKYLEIMKSHNDKLNSTNQKIMSIIDGGQSGYNGLVSKNSNSHDELIQNYKVLQKERDLIAKMLSEFDDLDESQNDTDLSTNQNYYSFILLSVIAVAFCVILFYFSKSSPKSTSIIPTIQQGGKRFGSLGLLFYSNVFFAFILIILIILFIKTGKKS